MSPLVNTIITKGLLEVLENLCEHLRLCSCLLGLALDVVPNSATVIQAAASCLWSLWFTTFRSPSFLSSFPLSILPLGRTLVVTVLPTFFWFWPEGPEAINLAVPQSLPLVGRCHVVAQLSGFKSSYLSLNAMTLTLCSFTGANGQRLNLASGPCQTDGSVLTRPSPAATVAVRVHGASLLP
jgi:hypothetical protein